MTNAELLAKIKAEIERRKAYQKQMYERRLPDGRPNYDWAESLAIMGELEELLSFLSTLESEKPIQEGLDVTDFCKPIDPGIAQCIADHSWEMLGEDEKPVPNDLEEAADNHIRKVRDTPGWDWTTQDIADAFIAGAKWQKEQMIKEAVEAKIYGYDDGSFELIASWLDMPHNSIYKDGDKIRIILVKEEDKK